MQGTYIPETNYVPREHGVAAIVYYYYYYYYYYNITSLYQNAKYFK